MILSSVQALLASYYCGAGTQTRILKGVTLFLECFLELTSLNEKYMC
jgi:hypothetical protein